jgi:hypothetical protein
VAQPPRHDHGPRFDRHDGPRHDMRRHHRHCRTVWHHGHRVRRCD